MAVAGLLPVLALVTHHLTRAVELENRPYFLQLPGGGICGMFVEIVAACIRLELVQFATESYMQLPLRTASPNFLRRPAQSRGVEMLPAGERGARRAANQNVGSLLQHQCLRLLTHVSPSEIPGVAVLVAAGQIQREAWYQLQARH